MNEIVTKEVIVVPYDANWPVQFEELKVWIESILKSWIVCIEHVGSTSVPGLWAKPVIDVDCVIQRSDFETVLRTLASHGFTNRGDLGIPDRYAIAGPRRPFRYHLYLTFPDARSYLEHIALRDWLRSHPADRERYATLKRALATTHRFDIDSYIEGKSAFIHDILVRQNIRIVKKD
jgi:GrpB-like predicted nucleotidyltransferase (UPF0157 family)